jgi:K+/H+ antiporter YhaU regulatory subunit KhtT
MQQRYETGQARYEQIAIDIAQKIVRGEYRVGQKLSGRSLLAGTYNVSPETIRRSIALLQNMGVTEAITGSGVIVKSKKLAEEFLNEYNERQEILFLQNKITNMLEKRRQLDLELEKELSRLLEFTFRRASLFQQIEEVVLPPNSWMVGRTIAETNLRHRTGTTILAVTRKGEEIYSPPAKLTLEGNDVLIIVGTTVAREKLKKVLKEGSEIEEG